MMRPEPNGKVGTIEHGPDTGSCCPGCRELLELVAHQLERLEPLMSLIENPPAMLAAMVPGLDGSGDD